ncbi:MAG TPA: SRPBCC family protein [Gemmatimonadaceae bacterium]|jgi:uncharacterized membrane protein|nr:SRPBCC family protein [Gemmatimonadaceae bacterium]
MPASDHGHIEPRAPGEIVSAAATVDARKAIKIEEHITIDRPRDELFRIWRNFEQLPKHANDLESVTAVGDGRTHWVARVPGGKRVEWDSEMVNEIPGELIAWKTVGNPDVAHAGSVHFRDAGAGATDVRVVVDYEPPGGRLGALVNAFTKLFGQSPEQKIRGDLKTFKERVESATPRRVD